MSQVSSNTIQAFRSEVVKYAQSLVDGRDNQLETAFAEAFGKNIGENYNLETIKKDHINKFKDDLRSQGMDHWGALRVAKAMVDEVFNDVMHEVQ